MRLTREARRISRKLFQSTLRNGRVDEAAVRKVVAGLVAKQPRYFLQILKDFKRQVRLELSKSECFVDSAQALSADERAYIVSELRKRHGDGLAPVFREVPELLGGLRVRLGSDVWDGSVRARLDRLASKL